MGRAVLDEGGLIVAERDEDGLLIQRFGSELEGEVVSGVDDVLVEVGEPCSRAKLAEMLEDLPATDAVMFWLGPADLAALATVPAPRARSYFSAQLARDGITAIPAHWRSTARVVFPFELPATRAANLAYFNAWTHQRQVPMVDEVMQSEVYFAFAFLTDTVSEMLDNVYRDYLIERAENMIGRREGSKAEAEYYSSTQSHVRTHSQADGVIAPEPMSAEAPGLVAQRLAGTAFGKREGTTAYPRLTLGPGQRFASKGAYLVRFAADGSLVADSDWIVP